MPAIRHTPELENEIILSISEGKSLTSWCKEHKLAISAVFTWFEKNPAFQEAYARARLMQVDYLAEEILDISDNLTIPDAHKRIMVDSRKWYAGKLNQQKYGDKQSIELTGKDGAPLSMRLIEAQQRLLKDITPQMAVIEHKPALDDII
jgi:hypothetical protein